MSPGRSVPTVGRPEPEAVRGMFTDLAPRYDLLNTVLSQGQDRRWRRRAAQLTRVKPGDRVLDVCTGTGALAAILARQVGGRGEVIGVDLTEAMLKVARSRVAGVRFQAADACQLPFPDRTFAAATMAFGLRNIADRPRALGELARVLRPGGRAVILEFSQVHPALGAAYAWYSRRLIPPIARLVLGRDSAYRYLTASIAAFATPEEVGGWMTQAGLVGVRVHRMSLGIVALHVGRSPVSPQVGTDLAGPTGT
ncbi:MAG: bifunctional demethylmenaquinone methyltransferase/2-methoxy-6-polyprenyl-1,4-benzoquinol methylase UbiE [Candidatus Dormibacteria bacterium]